MHLCSSIVDVLEYVGDHGADNTQRGGAINLLDIINRFDFVFVLHLMKNILGITHDKDQDIVNAMNLVKGAKIRLRALREEDWNIFLLEVTNFSSKHGIEVINMEDVQVGRGRSRRGVERITNFHHYHAELFCYVIDLQTEALDCRFDEVNTELLFCMACLDPRDSFSSFDKNKLLRLADFYPPEFSETALLELDDQLGSYIVDMRLDEKNSTIAGIGGPAQKMVATRKHIVFPSVYLLVKLSLILLVATATVERAFSAMKFIKNSLRNRMEDIYLNDCLVAYIEKDIFQEVSNEVIMQRFQNMKSRRGML